MTRTFRTYLLLISLLMPTSAQAVVWGYQGGGNDDEGWGTLSSDFTTCDLGHSQSPVDLSDPKASAMPPMKMHYRSAAMSMEKKDRTLVVSMRDPGYMTDEGHRWQLEEMRIHTPAEHEVAGKLEPAELHLIHRDDDGKLLIVAVFLDIRTEKNKALQAILDKAPAKAGMTVPLTFDPTGLLPATKGYYAYSGSLSWPPCTEGVEWRVMKDPVAITKAQMKAIGALLGRNARLLQPIYLRTVRQTIN